MAIHKCRRCVWSNKISSNLLYCIFPRCIIKEVTQQQAVVLKESAMVPKARTTCDDIRKRGKRYVPKKTKKAL